MEFYFHTWYVYGVEMYKLVNSEFSAANLALAGFPLTKTLGENLPSRL